MKIKIALFIGFLIISLKEAKSQYETIPIKTNSFETEAFMGSLISQRDIGSWVDCSFRGESVIDIHNDTTNFFEVKKHAVIGSHYLGLVTRDNDTWEGVSQKLDKPLKKNKQYILGFFASNSKAFKSNSRLRRKKIVPYNGKTIIKIELSDNSCQGIQTIYKSPVINHEEWRIYVFSFSPENNYTYLKLTAFYNTPILIPTSGNILLDGFSDIYEVKPDSIEFELEQLEKKMEWLRESQLSPEKRIAKLKAKRKRELRKIERELALKKEAKKIVTSSPKTKKTLPPKQKKQKKSPLSPFQKAQKTMKNLKGEMKNRGIFPKEGTDEYYYHLFLIVFETLRYNQNIKIELKIKDSDSSKIFGAINQVKDFNFIKRQQFEVMKNKVNFSMPEYVDNNIELKILKLN